VDLSQLAQGLFEIDQFENPHAHWGLLDFEKELRLPDSHSLLLHGPDAQIAAFLLFRVLYDEAWIMNIAVRPRKKGWAKKILTSFEEKLRSQFPQVKSLWLEVRQENTRAIEVYQNFGFIRVSERKGYYDHGRATAVVMSKCL
jgi:ribosomal-protein-alanine N-acetyltransferase